MIVQWLQGHGGYVVAFAVGFLFGTWLTVRKLRKS